MTFSFFPSRVQVQIIAQSSILHCRCDAIQSLNLFGATSNLMIIDKLNFVIFLVDLNTKVIRDIYLTTDFC